MTFDEAVVLAEEVASVLRSGAKQPNKAGQATIHTDWLRDGAELLDYFQTYAKTSRILIKPSEDSASDVIAHLTRHG